MRPEDAWASQLLTNLRAPLGHPTRFQEENRTFDPGPQRDQLLRFAAMQRDVTPGRRQFYGTPDPLPDYFLNTFADKRRPTANESQPTALLLGDPLMLLAAPGIVEELGERYHTEVHPKPLPESLGLAASLPEILSDRHWNTILLATGSGDIRPSNGKSPPSPAEFEAGLEKTLGALKAASDKVYWISIVPMAGNRGDATKEQALASEYNAAAERVCRKLDVYSVNLGEILEQAVPGYSKHPGRELSPDEAKEVGKKIASALKFLG